MRLFLVQHGQAAAKEEDPDRPLTDEGRRDVELLARHLANWRPPPEIIWHSGKTRAAQTAEIFHAAWEGAGQPTQRDGLAPDDDVAPLAEEMQTADGVIMIVGHMPFVGRLASLLVAGDESAEVVQFTPGTIAWIERDDTGAWSVRFVVQADD